MQATILAPLSNIDIASVLEETNLERKLGDLLLVNLWSEPEVQLEDDSHLKIPQHECNSYYHSFPPAIDYYASIL